jgi:hypothetical protein
VKWSVYNQSLVRRGEILLGFDVITNWYTELKELNKDKVGGPYHYPNTFLLLLGYAKVYFHLPYRQTEGIAQGHTRGKVSSIPDYSTINRRINKLNLKLKDDYIIIAIDGTGIKATNRGQWLRDKWNIRKGYVKIHIAVDTKSKKVLSLKVTNEHVHDSKMLPQLVKYVTKSQNIVIDKVLADGAYDGNDIFRNLGDNRIVPCIKVRKNSRVKWKKGNILRNLSVLTQKKDLQKWKDSIVNYGQR